MKVVCRNGLKMLIIANSFAYCSPRADHRSVYTKVEVGFPSEEIPELMPYVEDASKPTDTVYAYVPTSVIAKILNNAGGVLEVTGDKFRMQGVVGI